MLLKGYNNFFLLSYLLKFHILIEMNGSDIFILGLGKERDKCSVAKRRRFCGFMGWLLFTLRKCREHVPGFHVRMPRTR